MSHPKRIALDVRTLSGHYTGDRTYWRGLISGLAAIDPVNHYTLYSRLPIDGEPPSTPDTMRWVQLPGGRGDAHWILRDLPRQLAKDNIDLLHTQYNIPLLGCPCPVITTIADITFALYPDLFMPKDRWILNTFIPRSLRHSAAVITVSDSTRRDLLRRYKHHIVPDHVVTTHLAVGPMFTPPTEPIDSLRARIAADLDFPNRPFILSLGVLQPRKNLATLLDAFALAKLGKVRIPHQLVIAGKRGWKNAELDRHLNKIPDAVKRDIHWIGYVPDTLLPALYGAADMFCYPSLYEGFGLPPLEAMACGCPVICSRTSSLPEVVGDAGILLPATDSEAWAAALEKLAVRPEVRSRWRTRGLEQAQHFSWQDTAHKTLALYEQFGRH